jgi:hypothetical protein
LRIAAEPNVPHIEVDPVDAVEDQEEQGREHQEESDKKKNILPKRIEPKKRSTSSCTHFGK